MSRWKASGIIDAIKNRQARLPSLDPFNDLDPLLTESPNIEECFDISELDEDQILAFATRDEENESDDEKEIYIIHLTVMEIFLIFLIMIKYYNNFSRQFVYTNIGKRCLAFNIFFKFLVAFPQKSKEK